jgi:hypothetical protein
MQQTSASSLEGALTFDDAGLREVTP